MPNHFNLKSPAVKKEITFGSPEARPVRANSAHFTPAKSVSPRVGRAAPEAGSTGGQACSLRVPNSLEDWLASKMILAICEAGWSKTQLRA